MRLIDADALIDRMYYDAFENDKSYNEENPMAKWDSGLWIRYKMFESAIADAPTIEPKTQTETQNSNLTFEKRTMRDCYNCKRYETDGECVECHYEPKDEPQTDCAWK